MKKFTSTAYTMSENRPEAEGDLKANVSVMRDVCHAIALTYENFKKGDITLTSLVVYDSEKNDSYVIKVHHYRYGWSQANLYTFPKRPQYNYVSAFQHVFDQMPSTELRISEFINENRKNKFGSFTALKEFPYGAKVNKAYMSIHQYAGVFQAAEANLLMLYREICRKVESGENAWDEFGIEDPEKFKSEVEFLEKVRRAYLG